MSGRPTIARLAGAGIALLVVGGIIGAQAGWSLAAAAAGAARRAQSPGTVVMGDAPGAEASARGLMLETPATCLACAEAAAGPHSSTARAGSLRLLGSDVGGGSSAGQEARSGALVTLRLGSLAGFAVAPWSATSASGPAASHADSHAALLAADAMDGELNITLLPAHAEAWDDGHGAGSRSATSLADARAGRGLVTVVLLHSEASSNGRSSVCVGEANGGTVLETDSSGGSRSAFVTRGDPLKVTALGTAGAPSSTGAVLRAGAIPGPLHDLDALVLGSDASGDAQHPDSSPSGG